MELTLFQYGLITNLMSLTVAGMGAAALFFFLSRPQVAPAYRPALLLVELIAVLNLPHALGRSLMLRLGGAALLMIALG